MALYSDDNGITIKKLFKTQKISYGELKSILIDSRGITFSTRDGGSVMAEAGLRSDLEGMYKAIPKYNIAFRNEEETPEDGQTYTIDEIYKKVEEVKGFAYGIAAPAIRSRYGDEYDIVLNVEEIEDFVDVYFCLTKSGMPVQFFEAFDDIVIAYLVEWDAGLSCGRYGVTVEVNDKDLCRDAVMRILEYVYDNYKPGE